MEKSQEIKKYIESINPAIFRVDRIKNLEIETPKGNWNFNYVVKINDLAGVLCSDAVLGYRGYELGKIISNFYEIVNDSAKMGIGIRHGSRKVLISIHIRGLVRAVGNFIIGCTIDSIKEKKDESYSKIL